MRKLVISLCLAALAGCGTDQSGSDIIVQPADLVLTNGNVLTVDSDKPRAEAIAIRGDRIVAVDTASAIGDYVGDETEVVDLQGQTAIPGFIEGHGHYTSFGGSLLILDFRYAESFSEIVSMVAEKTRACRSTIR